MSLLAASWVEAAQAQSLRWATSGMHGRPDATPGYALQRRFPELKFDNPVESAAMPGSGSWMWLMELRGRVHAFQGHLDNPPLHLVIDLKRAIKGVAEAYGLAFHPDFARNHQVFLCYVMGGGAEDGTRVSRFQVDVSGPPRLLPESEEILLTWKGGGHNGGCLRFGPDGMLYISTGDGSGPVPPDSLATGQDLSDLLASVLRIDVDHRTSELAYAIPSDNPFVGLPEARPEIWAFGFRNPFKMSFEPGTGDLWLGDVGWELWELVVRVKPGGNHGWSLFEGSHRIQTIGKQGPGALVKPVVEHPHSEAASITGGLHYQGSSMPALQGAYIYGDWQTGKIWALSHHGDKPAVTEELLDSSLQIIAFAEDPEGELLVLDYGGGLYQIRPISEPDTIGQFPRLLSQTGVFSDTSQQIPASGVAAYQVSMEPWENGAKASRWVAIPEMVPVELNGHSPAFPSGSVLAKTLSWQNTDRTRHEPIETQILHFDGQQWYAYSYIWDAEGKDAELAPAQGRRLHLHDKDGPLARVEAIGGPDSWQVGARADCLRCHNSWNGFALGWNPLQLSPHRPEQTQVAQSSQVLRSLDLIQKDLPALELAAENQEALNYKARSYLHANCAPCHRENAGGMVESMLYLDKPLNQAGLLDHPPMRGDFGVQDARVIAPGDPFRSMLYLRMAKSGAGHMPLIGPRRVDAQALANVFDWIMAMKPSVGQPNLTVEALKALEGLENAMQEPEQEAQLDRMMQTLPGLLALSRALDQKALSAELRARIEQRFQTLKDPLSRDILIRFFESSDGLIDGLDADAIGTLQGEADRGKLLFHDDASLQCSRCHQKQGKGQLLGPPLDGLHLKYSRDQILFHLLNPSDWVDPSYRLLVLETLDGEGQSGRLIKESDSHVWLLDLLGQEQVIAKKDILERQWSEFSIMPEGLLDGRSPQDVADLIAYLLAP